jgi:nicotinamidase-related amidase
MIRQGRYDRATLTALGAILFIGSLTAATVHAADIMDQWSTVTIPPPPALQSVSVDSQHTALLLLDISVDSCTDAKRPSCVRSIAPIKALLDDARSHKLLVLYAAGPPTSTTSTKPPAPLAPVGDESIVRAGPDKFYNSDLDKILAAHGIESVIIVGTSAQGAVLYTASSAALRGLAVIVPVDGYSSDSSNLFPELYTAWHLKNAPQNISSHVRLTRTNMISIH